MINNPIFILARINTLLAEIDDAQDLIDDARTRFPEDEMFQLALDFKEFQLLIRRTHLEAVKERIPSMN